MTGQLVDAALLAVDDADRVRNLQSGSPQRLDRLDRGAARGDDVLDETHALTLAVHALELIGRPVALRLLADDQERQPACKRRGRGQRDGSELGPGQAIGGGLVLADRCGDRLAEWTEQVGPRLEPVLVEVVLRAAAGAEQEVALEV